MRPANRADSHAAFGGALGHLGSLLWAQTMGRAVQRTLAVPAGVRVIAVGGATLGGSGKTPLAIACAQYLAAMGARVTIVGHAYRAKPGRPRIVSPSDRLEDVGDEALLAARIFERTIVERTSGTAGGETGKEGGPRPRVVVAPRRAAAIAWAAPGADVLILDGVAQTAPVRASLALLAVDGAHPWGRTRALPPMGDLRAALPVLLDACDVLVPIHDGVAPTAQRLSHPAPLAAFADVAPLAPMGPGGSTEQAHPITEDPWLDRGADGREPIQDAQRPHEEKPVFSARADGRGAWDENGALRTWEALRSVRVGLLTALARPERVIASLARRQIYPRVVFVGRDHGPISAAAAVDERDGQARHVDLWLATPKCALHAKRARLALPLATLDYSVMLPPRLCARLARVFEGAPCLDRREPGP
ncbi:MAG TPA: tetraacyldisaccharide 4'-kinase [Polyangiaceae bacterium]|jgi:tetraacyldisaccharide-1-P 4'-kinase|nr:tetraacyldisaccharide 4'-kinase [Polyangiaceae bacterium]